MTYAGQDYPSYPDDAKIAEAFSRHRFSAVYDHLDEAVRWEFVGQSVLEGKAAVVARCEETLASLRDVGTEFLRFKVVGSRDTIAIDSVARYTAEDYSTADIASCDIYDFLDGKLVAITSYFVDLSLPD